MQRVGVSTPSMLTRAAAPIAFLIRIAMSFRWPVELFLTLNLFSLAQAPAQPRMWAFPLVLFPSLAYLSNTPQVLNYALLCFAPDHDPSIQGLLKLVPQAFAR
jgi:hypothetical protein